MRPQVVVRVSWIYTSAVVCSLASMGILGWGHMAGMLAGALMIGDD